MQNIAAAVGTLFFLNLTLLGISWAQGTKAPCDLQLCSTTLETSVKECMEAPQNPDDQDPTTTYRQCIRDARTQYVKCFRDTCPNEGPVFPLQH